MSGDPDQIGLAPIIRTRGTGLLVPLSPGSTDAEHRADQELGNPEPNPPAPPPPPPLPPGPPSEEGAKDDEGDGKSGESDDTLEHMPLDPESPLFESSPLGRQEILAHEIGKVVRSAPQVPSPGVLLGAAMKDVGVDPSGRHLTEVQKAFRDALEEEENVDLLCQLSDALYLYELAYEYGVGIKHFDNFAKAVHARNYTLIGQYSKVFKTLLRFQGVTE